MKKVRRKQSRGVVAAKHRRPMVVKVQMPLGGDATEALIYDESRRLTLQAPVEQVRGIMGEDIKAYFNARITRGGKLTIEGRTADQDLPW